MDVDSRGSEGLAESSVVTIRKLWAVEILDNRCSDHLCEFGFMAPHVGLSVHCVTCMWTRSIVLRSSFGLGVKEGVVVVGLLS